MTTYADPLDADNVIPCGPDCACAAVDADEEELDVITTAINISLRELAQAAYDQGVGDGIAQAQEETRLLLDLVIDPPDFGDCTDPECSCRDAEIVDDDEAFFVNLGDDNYVLFDAEGKSDTELIAELAGALGTTLDGLEAFTKIVGFKFEGYNTDILYLADQVGNLNGTVQVLIEQVTEIQQKSDADAVVLEALVDRVADLESGCYGRRRGLTIDIDPHGNNQFGL